MGAARHDGTAPMRLTWFAVARSPYNDFLFASLAQKFDLQVWYQQKGLSTHPWRFEESGYEAFYVDGALHKALPAARAAECVVLSGWNDWRYLLLSGAIPSKTPRAFWTDPPEVSRRAGVAGRLRAAVMRYVFARFDQIWSTGSVGCRALVELGCPQDKVLSFPFFYDLTRYASVTQEQRAEAASFRAAHCPPGGPYVVFACMGQLAKKKRFDDAIEALASVPNAVLWLCGVGPEEPALRALADRLGVADRVVFHGWLQRPQLELVFLSADVLVHPAAFDPFPTVVLEAMTWAMPVIGTDVAGSVVDRVEPGRNGFVHRPGDVSALTRHMQFFTDDPGQAAAFGARARETAQQYPVTLAHERVRSLADWGSGR